MTGIVFESYAPEAPSTALGVLPALRSSARTSGTFVGLGRLPLLAQMRGTNVQAPQRLPLLKQAKVPGSQSPQLLPSLRGRASVTSIGGGTGNGVLPAVLGFGSATSVIPQITLGYGTLPNLLGSGTSRTEAAGTGQANLPAVRSRAFANGADTDYGAGVLPKTRSWAFASDLSHTAYISAVQSPGIAYMVGSSDTIALLSDAITFSASSIPTWVQILFDALQLASSPNAIWASLQKLADTASFDDALELILRALLVDSAELSSAPSAWVGVVLALLDKVVIGSAPSATYDAHVSIALAFALRELIDDAQRGLLADGVSLTETLTQYVTAFAALLDSWQATAAQTTSAILHALLSDTAALSDSLSDYLQIKQALIDGAQFGITLYTGQDTYVAWVMTAPTRAMRRYLNYPFNSFGELDGRLCGANDKGVYWLDGDTDDGTPIPAMVRTGLLDFGTRQLKQMDRAYLGYTSDGTLCLRVTTTSETGDKVEYTYQMTPVTADAPREQRVKIGRGMRSVYWQFELTNDSNGSSFELHDVSMLPIVLTRRVY